MKVLWVAALTAAFTAGCATAPPSVPPRGAIVPSEGKVQLTSSIGYSYEELIMAPVTYWSLEKVWKQPLMLYFVYQPLAPNWSVEEAALGDDTYYLRLQAKRFRTGGDGEAMQVLKRRALQLQQARGFAGYRILDYSEGVESGTPVAQRVSEGVVQLVRADAVAR
jgi:hypothetical protein